MDLKRATALFTEMVNKCPELEGRNFLIMKMNLPHPIETLGYEIIVKTDGRPLGGKTLKILRDIVAREKLKLEEKETSIMIYAAIPIEHSH